MVIVKGLGILVSIIIVIALVIALAFGAMYLGGFFAVRQNDINRQVIQHSQLYIQTHQTMLMSWYSDYQSGDAAHQAAAKIQICQNAPLLETVDWPAQIAAFVSQNC